MVAQKIGNCVQGFFYERTRKWQVGGGGGRAPQGGRFARARAPQGGGFARARTPHEGGFARASTPQEAGVARGKPRRNRLHASELPYPWGTRKSYATIMLRGLRCKSKSRSSNFKSY